MTENSEKIRIDRFLWAARQFKTRSQSSEACKRKWISINENTVKASRIIKIGDVIRIKHPSHFKTIQIIQFLKNRVSAKIVNNFVKDLTSEEEYEKERNFRKNKRMFYISSLKGRPSKKNRRDIDDFISKL